MSQHFLKPVIGAIVGSTGVGKTAVGLNFARANNIFDVLSIDSMAVYKDMNIGTAKATPKELGAIRLHLVDLVTPDKEFSMAEFRIAAIQVLEKLALDSKPALLIGGSGLYFRAITDSLIAPPRFPEIRSELEQREKAGGLWQLYVDLEKLDPVAASKMEPNNMRRIIRALEVCLGTKRKFSSYGPGLTYYPSLDFPIIGLRMRPELLRQRIVDRFYDQINRGFIEEVKYLLDKYPVLSKTAARAHGYLELARYVRNEIDLAQAIEASTTTIMKYTKRQMQWWRRDPRVIWLDVDDMDDSTLISKIQGIVGSLV
jgi:tRNA dimethylallyltransferase